MFLSRDEYEQRLPFVRRTAMRLARRVPASISVGDLVGSGFVGLVEALAHASPDTPEEDLDEYLSYRIRGAMLDYVRSCDDRTTEVWSESRRLTRAIGKLDRELGRAPSEDEIAAAMELSRAEYRNFLRSVAAIGQVPLEAVSLDPERDDDPLAEPDEDESSRPGITGALAEAIAFLPEELQHVLALHHQEGCTPLEIAMVLDLDEDRVIELQAEAVHRLRAGIAARREPRPTPTPSSPPRGETP
jgi:RNA polymerase sigma factor for flagellar operon FliA